MDDNYGEVGTNTTTSSSYSQPTLHSQQNTQNINSDAVEIPFIQYDTVPELDSNTGIKLDLDFEGQVLYQKRFPAKNELFLARLEPNDILRPVRLISLCPKRYQQKDQITGINVNIAKSMCSQYKR